MSEAEQQVTEEQAGEALQQLVAMKKGKQEEEVQAVPEAEPSPEAEAPSEPAEPQPAEAAAEGHEDDLESLQNRYKELDERLQESEKTYQSRIQAARQRYEQNEKVLRDRFLQKSNVVSRALAVLKAADTDQGVTKEEVQNAIRELEGTMHPQSASYAPPQPQPQPVQQPQFVDDRQLTVNSFLNEKSMTEQEAGEFSNWITSEAEKVMTPAEQAVAESSLDGFLRLAHYRWQQEVVSKKQQAEEKRDAAVGAVRAVQRTQRAAAKAASAAPAATRKQPASSPAGEVDVSKLTDDDVSALIRQSVEQYK